MKSRLGLTALFLCGIAASPLAAQDAGCVPTNSIEDVVGNYRITNGPGQVINVGGIGVIPSPATGTLTATLTQYGSRLGLDSEVFGSLVVDFEVVDDPDEKWNFGDSEIFTGPSSDDINDAFGCGNSESLMRLFGTGVTSLPDVGERSVTMRLIVFPDGILVGRMDVIMVAPATLQTKITMIRTN